MFWRLLAFASLGSNPAVSIIKGYHSIMKNAGRGTATYKRWVGTPQIPRCTGAELRIMAERDLAVGSIENIPTRQLHP